MIFLGYFLGLAYLVNYSDVKLSSIDAPKPSVYFLHRMRCVDYIYP